MSDGWHGFVGRVIHQRRLLITSFAPLAVVLILFALEVPFGRPGVLVYPYAQSTSVRILVKVPMALLAASLLLWAVDRIPRTTPRGRRMFVAVAFLSFILLGVWTMFAPCVGAHGVLHIFNMESPSHDGAFMREARSIANESMRARPTAAPIPITIRDYLRHFPEWLQRSPEQLRGTRVLSNPPGMTLLCLVTLDWPERFPALSKRIQEAVRTDELNDSDAAKAYLHSYYVSWLLTTAWILSVAPAYLLGRLWMSVDAAIVFALCTVFNPSTLNFTPGKDPAQMLTVLAFLYLWFSAAQRGQGWRSFLSGVVLIVGSVFGLIHLWLAGIAVGATLLQCATKDTAAAVLPVRRLGYLIGCWAMGVVVAASFAWITLDWNIPATIWTVARRYSEIQREIITDPIGWTFLGLPMFLLFAGPGVWASLLDQTSFVPRTMGHSGAISSNSAAGLGRSLLMLTVIVLVYTYFFANNSETPRLWMPFIPLLVLGLALKGPSRFEPSMKSFPDQPPRGLDEPHSLGSQMSVLAACQIVVTLLHGSLMDVREAEMRLLTGDFFF